MSQDAPASGASAKRRAVRLRTYLPFLAAAIIGVAAILAVLKIESERRGGPSDPRALSAEFAKSGDYQNAANVLRAAYRADPSEQLRLEAARALLVAGDNYAALELLKDHATESTFEFSRRHLYAEALVRARRYEAAAKEASLLAASSAADGRARLLAARIAYGLGDFDRASGELGAAIRTGGESLAEAWLFRARIALNDNDIDAARGAAARAGEAKAPPAALRAIEVEALARAGDYDGARAAHASLKASQDDLARLLALKLTAFLDASQGRYTEAARLLRDIGGIIEADPYGDLFIVRVAALAGDAAQSAAGVEKALESSPENGAIAEAGVDRLIEEGRLEEAEAAAAHLRVREPLRGVRTAMRVARARQDWEGLARLALSAPVGRPPATVDAMLFGLFSAAASASAQQRTADRALIDATAEAKAGTDAAAVEAALGLAGEGADAAALLVAADILIAVNADSTARRLLERAPASVASIIGSARLDIRAGDLLGAERRLSRAGAAPEILIMRARALARQGRLDDAAAILSPLAASWPAGPADAAFAADIFAKTESRPPLLALAAQTRRRFADAREAADVLFLAGRGEDALSAARAAVLSAPADPDRAARYAEFARRLDRVAEARAFLAGLAAAEGESEELKVAVRILDGTEPAADAETEPVQIRDVRNAYMSASRSPEAARAYARALAAAGEQERSLRLTREACFWSSEAVCDRQ